MAGGGRRQVRRPEVPGAQFVGEAEKILLYLGDGRDARQDHRSPARESQERLDQRAAGAPGRNQARHARERGARTLAITNMMGTQITREVDATLYSRCGIEIGVAASKTFTTQVALLSLLALKFADIRRTLPSLRWTVIVRQLRRGAT